MPDWRDEIRRRLEPLGLPPTREAEIAEELAQHLEDRYQDLLAQGRPEDEAAAGAWREIEASDFFRREVARLERPAPLDLPPPGAPGSWNPLASLWHDLRHAVRTLRRAPAFSLTVLAAFALTIGPTTAIVSVGNWLMWRPHPGVSQPRQLAEVMFGQWESDSSLRVMTLPRETVHELLAGSSTMTGLAGGQELGGSLVIAGSLPRSVGVAHVNGSYFDVLGIRMRAGRPILTDDDKLGAPHIALIAERTARNAFGPPEAALDRTITLNNRPFTVIGVVDAAFSGISPVSDVEVWVPASSYHYLRHFPAPRDTSFYTFVARLKPDSGAPAAAAELNARMRALFDRDPKTHGRLDRIEARVFPGLAERPLMRQHRREQLRTMLAIAATLLLLGCANVANLLIFRTTRAQHEIAVRKALGASRARLIQAQLAESCVLAIAGAAVGLGLAYFLKQLMQQLLFPRPPGMDLVVPIDMRVLGMTVAAALVTGLIAAAAPAVLAARRSSAAGLRSGAARTSTASLRLRGGLAALQLALSLTLLVGALLLITTLKNLRGMDLGFEPDDVTAMSVTLDSHGYKPDQVISYFRQVMPAMAERGDVENVAIAVSALDAAYVLDIPRMSGGDVESRSNGVTHNYFRTLEIPILRGRDFGVEEAFILGGDPPVILNASLATQVFGTLDVVGRDLTLKAARRGQAPRTLPIIGVVGDVQSGSLTGPPAPMMYQPIGRFVMPPRGGEILVRSPLPPLRVGTIVGDISSRAAATVPVAAVRPLSMDVDRQLTRTRLFAWLLGLLGAFGFVLASLGLYGLVSQTAAERRREFGIRLAIGARPSDIIRLIARYAAAICLAGSAAGLALAFYGTRLVESMLHGVTRLDPAVYATALAALLAVVLLACLVPAIRATGVQPVEVLRAE
ncbi:MAG TPA: ABC transporter permease [Vicinamibacterales bacterium]